MKVMEHLNSNYNYYPRTAIELCKIAYDEIGNIKGDVSANTDNTVVWGPAQLVQYDDIPYSLMYISNRNGTDEYFVVIRGTNPDSLTSWLEEDFKVGSTRPFGSLPGNPPGVPVDALISLGTYNGMADLLSLRDPQSNLSAVDFLKQIKPHYLYVTGHSLGGTLTPPLFAYLNAMLYGGSTISNMALWSFAGLTPGGRGFNNYFNNLIPNDQGFLWRIHNTLDIAPFLWYSLNHVENIYNYNPYFLQMDFLEKDALSYLFNEANKANIGYAQPQNGLALSGQFDTSYSDNWAYQAMQQHHSTTYQALINAFYPA